MNFLLRASRAILLTVALMSFAVSVAPIHAAPGVRANVTYQARLMDASGYPVADGVYQVEFSLYDAAVAGNRLWTADGTVGAPLPVNVTVQDGLFTVLLGDGVTQLPFGEIDWNSDSLYLGVTIGADGEMSPRRPITAVPQAINSAQLSGMSPSSTDTYGGESQFTILQASTTAATSTRSALDVRSNGTSVANDFILRAITNAGSPVFTITSQGVVSTTNLLVSGQSVCLNDGTNCSSLTESDTLQEVVSRGATTTVALTLFGGASTSELFVTSTLNVSGLVTSSLNPSVDLVQGLGTASLRWNGYFGTVTTTNLLATGLIGTSATFTNATATNLFAALVSSSQIIVNGQDVCLEDGTNCAALAAEADTLALVTGRGATSSVAVTFFGGVTSSNLNVSGTSNLATINASSVAISGGLTAATGSITGLSWTNATGTSTTGTNAFFANLRGATSSFSELYSVSSTLGQATATAFFTQTFTATNAGITNVTATNLAFTNASGASMIVTVLNSSTVNASSSNIDTATIGIANVTTGTITSLVFTNATGATLSIGSVSATSLLVSGQNVCLANGTNCLSMYSTDTLAMVTARGATTSVAVTFFGGVTSSNINVTGTANAQYLNASSVAILNGLSASTATFSNATTGGLSAGIAFIGTSTQGFLNVTSTLRATSGTITDLNSTNLFSVNGLFTGATSTNSFATTASSTNLFSTNGSISVLTGNSLVYTNATFTNVSSTLYALGSGTIGSSIIGTSTIGFVNVTGSLFSPTGTITSLNVSNLFANAAVFTNGTSSGFASGIGSFGTSTIGSLNVTSSLLFAGVNVCLQDGSNCASATTTLQAAYTNGRFVTLNDGRIEFEGVSGAQDEFGYLGITATPILGAGYAGATGTGFDLSLGYGGSSGTFFSFTDNRNDPGATVNTSYLVHIPGNDNTLLLGNATSFIQFDNDIVDITNGSNEIFLDQGQQFFTADSDITGDTPFTFQDNGTQSSIIGLANSNGLNLIHLGSDANPNGAYLPQDSGDLLIRSGSTGGSGTQIYVNVDGTITGWRGLATVDMLTGGSGDLQSAYDNGKVIVTSDGAIELIGSATATIVGTTDIPLLTATFVSGTNEGLDLALFSNSAVPLWSGTGTGMFYRHDQTIDVTNTTSSGLAFSDDGVQSYATLYTKQTGIGSFKYVTLDNSGIDISPGSGGTTTFMDNVALNSSARFDSNILPRFTNTFGLGSSSLRWNNFVQSLDIAGTVTGDLIPSANLTYDLGSLGAAWNEAFIDTVTANTIGTAALTVGGQNVCLLDGTNCPVTSLSWVYDGANGLVRLTTSSNDIVLGASATSTGAPVYLETNQTVGTSTLFIGYSTSANLIIGGTSSTMSHMHSLFSGNFNGNDLYVGGNIGSASSVYTLGEFVVGTGSFKIGNGTLTKTDGAITVSASNGFFLPATDLGISLGSLTQRFNGYFNNVTSTNATTSNLVAGNVTVTSTLTASSVTMFGGISQTLSSSTQVTTEYSSALAFSGSTSVDLTVSGDTYFTVASTGTFPLRTRSIITGFSYGNSASNVKNYSPSYADDSSSVRLKYDGSITLGSNTVYTTSTFDLTTSSVLYANGNMILVGDKTTIYTFTLQRGSSQSDAIAYVGQFLVSGTAQGIISIEDDTRSDGQFVISYYDAGATRLRRLTCNVGSACISVGSASNGISASPVEVRAMGGYYYAPIPETNSVVRFNNTGSWTTSTSYVMGDASARRIAAQNGYIAVVGQNLSVIDTKSNTRKTLEGVVGTTFSDVEMIGDTIVVVSNLGEYQYSLGGVRAPGAEFGSLTVGSASFDGDVYTKQSLKVGSGISVLQGGMDLQGGLTVGRGNAYISGSLDVNQHAFFGLESATDTVEYRTVISYSGGSFSSGLCLDDTQTIDSCPASGLFGTSLMADGTINASNFDLAEMYAVEGPAEAGDVLVFNQSATATVEMSGGTRYDRRIAGVVSTRPGLLLGWAAASQTQVALAGRVPTKISMTNGEIKIGDPLTTSEYPGYAMKATKPGMILGYALEDLSATGTIEVFVDTSYNASAALGSDGTIATVTDNLVMVGAEAATATTTAVGSYGLTFHGEGWDTTSSMSLAYDFTLRTDMLSSTNSRFVIENNFGSSTFSVDQEGIVRANGYEVNDAFDLAERYESADQLEPGDLVMISKDADRQILRTNADEAIAIGVISTKAGFTLGANASGTFPVALAGRVPTKVTTMGGAIQRGDALMASTIPGVAQKATVAGQIIGYALENYEGDDNGLVEVFIQPGLWIPQTGLDAMANAPATGSGMGSGPARQGFAKVTTGGSRVSIKYTSILAYPVPQVTAMGNVSGGWWLENVSDVGFDIVMDTIQPIDIQFAWQVSPAQTGIMQYHSDGTYGQLDPLTGQLIENPEVDSEEPVIEAPVVEESAPEVITEGE